MNSNGEGLFTSVVGGMRNIIRWNRTTLVLFGILVINFCLNLYGNDWGLPSRWYVDEKVASVLHMGRQKILYDPIGVFLHPTGYHIFLLIFFVPLFLILKFIHFPLDELSRAASISWIEMARQFPEFATGIYIYARTLSALLGTATVYLIYLLGKTMYGKREALFAAGTLGVCMGFIGVNHFAKYISLLNFFIVLTLYLSVKALKTASKNLTHRYLLAASLSGGFAVSVHLNGPILLIPLLMAFGILAYETRPSWKAVLKALLIHTGIFVSGFLLGMPSILSHFSHYFSHYASKYSTDLVFYSPAHQALWVGPLNTLFEICSIYGLPLALFIFSGLLFSLVFWKSRPRGEILILAFVLTYAFIMTILFEDKYPQVKHIIAIVPLLALFGARSLTYFVSEKKFVPVAIPVVTFIFLYSLLYSAKSVEVFRQGDTRHQATEWIYKNIPQGAKIEVFNQLNYVAKTSLFYDYEIIYLGQSSRHQNSHLFFKWNIVKNRESYLNYINKKDSASDYIVVNINDLQKLYTTPYMRHIPGIDTYLSALFKGEKGFDLVRVIMPKNKKIVSKRLPGWIHFENLLWPPIPIYKATANTIYIFKKKAHVQS